MVIAGRARVAAVPPRMTVGAGAEQAMAKIAKRTMNTGFIYEKKLNISRLGLLPNFNKFF